MAETNNTTSKAAAAFAKVSGENKVDTVEKKDFSQSVQETKDTSPKTIEAEVVTPKTETTVSSTGATPNATTNGEKKKGSKVWIIVILVIVLLLCCGCGSIALISKVGWDAIKNFDLSNPDFEYLLDNSYDEIIFSDDSSDTDTSNESETDSTSSEGLTKVEGDNYIMYFPSSYQELVTEGTEKNYVSTEFNASGGYNSINMVTIDTDSTKIFSQSDCDDLADYYTPEFAATFEIDEEDIFSNQDFETVNGVNICTLDFSMYFESSTLYSTQKVLSNNEDELVVIYTISRDDKYSDEGLLLENALELSTIK